MCIGHVAPESEVGGPIGLVQDGDTVRVSIPNRTLDLMIDEETLLERRASWKPQQPRYSTGALAKYARLVGSAERGAVTG